jgi:hypothetical protein
VAITLDDVAGHEGGSVVVALETARGQVALDLQAKEVARVLLLELSWVVCVEFNTESQERIDQRESDLAIQCLLQIEPVFRARGGLRVLETEVVRLQEVQLPTDLLEQHLSQGLCLKSAEEVYTRFCLHKQPALTCT